MQAEQYFVLGHRVTPLSTIGDYGLVEIVSPSGVPGPPPHHHVDAAEFFYIADGELRVMVGDDWRTLRAGESLCLPKGTVHTLRNDGEKDCRWLTGWSPRGFEQFFVDFGVNTNTPDASALSVADDVVRRVVTDCARYGMVVHAP